MSLAFGYIGPQMMASKFAVNPLASVPPSTIQLCDYEIADALSDTPYSWDQLNPSQQREVARRILLRRDDEVSRQQLDCLGLNTTGYNTFEVIYTGRAEASVPDDAAANFRHFLL